MLEIERKFLLPHLPADLETHPHYDIEQGYLAMDENAETRLRRSDKERCLTVKQRARVGRQEINLPLTEEQWNALWPMTDGRRVYKRRYEVPHGDVLIEIDVYQRKNAGLAVAEVEFPSGEAAEAFVAPEWFGRDVSGEAAYRNTVLATERG
jgi:CYTH domain-containing protein